MWVAVGVALLLLAFGSKVASVLIGCILLAVHKVGLLSNIHVGDGTVLSVSIRAVHISVWRNVWGFLRAPTQEPLITIDFSGVHFVVLCRPEGRQRVVSRSAEQAKSRIQVARFWKDLDPSISLKRLDHPMWKTEQSFMHRVPFLWLAIPAVGISSSDVMADVVCESPKGSVTTVSLKKGQAILRFQFRQPLGEIDLVIRLCPLHAARVNLPGLGIELTMRDTSVKISVPVSRKSDDFRAPMPSAAHVRCQALWCSIDLTNMLRRSERSEPRVGMNMPFSDDLLAILSSHVALLRVMEIIPATSVKFCSIQFVVAAGPTGQVESSLDSVELCISDPLRGGQLEGWHGEDRVVERRIVLEAYRLSISNRHSEQPDDATSLRLDSLKLEADNRLAQLQNFFEPGVEESRVAGVSLDWSTRCSGEARGLSAVLSSDISPLVSQISASIPPNVRSTARELETECVNSNSDNTTWEDFIAIDIQVQLKLVRTEMLCIARDRKCAVLRKGVPDIGLFIDEIALNAFPFVSEESLGVRAMADVHGSRLKLFYIQRARMTRTNFTSIDIVRVLYNPVTAFGLNPAPAEVDMEAEWLEVRWTAEAMHAIGGMLDLGVFVFQPFFQENYDWTDDEHWGPQAFTNVQHMRSMSEVVQDDISESESIKFRCKVKNSLVFFTHDHGGKSHGDYITVDTLSMSVEESTGRFRLSILDTKVYHIETSTTTRTPPETEFTHQFQQSVRSRWTRFGANSAGRRTKGHGDRNGPSEYCTLDAAPFFRVRAFGLEENKLPSCPMTVLDLFVDGVTCHWDMKTQDRIIELIRRITFSSWEMLYRFRSTFGIHCTPPGSRYNREGGINGTLDDVTQCMLAEKLLLKLISAGGDTLNRIQATNVIMHTQFGNEKNPFYVQLSVGVFGSQDLPELWNFDNVCISIGGSLNLLQVDQISLRHTVHKRRDYVFGFYEETLWQRQLACGKRHPSSPREDGMMIEIEGLRICLSLRLDLVEVACEVQRSISPYLASQMKTFQANWRPKEDVFYLFFLRMPNAIGQPSVWLQLSNCQIECDDNPMEAWLERVYPVWMEESAEQEMRVQLLEEQVTSLRQTNADLLISDEIADKMKYLLREKNSKIYTHKVRRMRENHHSVSNDSTLDEGKILSIRIGYINIDISSESNESRTNQLIRELDEATAAIDRILISAGLNPAFHGPLFSFRIDQSIEMSMLDLCMRVRNFLTPIAVADELRTGGKVVVAAHRTPPGAADSFPFTGALRCFIDFDVAIRRPVLFFGPAYLATIQDLVTIAERVLPTVVLDVDRVHHSAPWDIARRLLHGRLYMVVDDASVRLLAASNTFEVGGYLELGIHHVDLRCRRSPDAAIEVDFERVTLKIHPDALVNIAEITSLAIETKATWTTQLEPSIHYILPVEYQQYGETLSSESTVIDFQQGGVWDTVKMGMAERLDRYRGVQVVFTLSGKIAPKTTPIELTRRDIASRSAIVLYAKHVEWLIRFGRLYEAMAHQKLPKRRQCSGRQEQHLQHDIMPPLEQFLRVFRGVTLEDFGVVGLDFALYHSEKSQVGVRACVNDRIHISGKMGVCLRGAEYARSTSIRHVSLDWRNVTLDLEAIAVAVCDVQVRICTPSTGSRGESLVSIRDVCLNVGDRKHSPKAANSNFDFAKLHAEFDHTNCMDSRDCNLVSASSFRSTSSFEPLSRDGDQSTDPSRTKSKRTILEHFAISQHNPYRYRDDNDNAADNSAPVGDQIDTKLSRPGSDRGNHAAFVDEFRRQGYLLGLAASEIRVLVTLDTVETMIDVAENWIRVIRSSFPEFYRVPDLLLKEESVHHSSTNQGLESPKKVTSLADDPRFGPIFHASNPLPSNKAPSFNMSTMEDGAVDNSNHVPSSLPSGVAHPFLTVRFLDCQINFHDRQNKGSVLIALGCGSLHHSRSQDIKHELIDLRVDGLQLLTAPLDIDVKSRVIWLRTLGDGFTYCPSSFGLLKRVVAPIPTKLMVWVDRELIVMNRVDLSIPNVQIAVSIDSKIILEDMMVSLLRVITAKLAEYQLPDYSKMLQDYQGPLNQADIRVSLQQLVNAKQELKWKIADQHWRHLCRWNYQVMERAHLAMQAVEGVRAHIPVKSDLIPSPFVDGHRLSSLSLASSIGTSLCLTGSVATQVETTPDELQRLQEQHDSIAEVLRSLVKSELVRRQPNPNLQLTFTLETASLTLSSASTDIINAAMTKLKVKLKMYENHSGSLALTIQGVCCKNLCPNTPYPELLIPHAGSKSWSGDEMFVRVDAEVAQPVGGIIVVRHFEINVHPMQVCLSYDLIFQLVAFFTSVSTTATRQEEKEAEVRSQFLSAPQATSSTTGEGLFKKAAKVAGKAAHPLTHGLARLRSDSGHDQRADSRGKVVQTLQEEATQWIFKIARVETNQAANSGDEVTCDADKDANEMRERINNNILFKRIRLGTVEVMVSFKNKKSHPVAAAPQQPLEDMRGFEVKIHSLVYLDKTCSLMDLLLRIRRDVILDVLSQVGRNFTNVANFLRDQLDITRWGAFDALAPLKSLSTAFTGSGHSPCVVSPSSASPDPMADMLQRSPRISHDGVATLTSPSPRVDISRGFQLELPENHPSRRKKHASIHTRPSEPTFKSDAPPTSPQADIEDAAASASGGKPKKILSSFFGKTKKLLQPDADDAPR